MPGNHDIHNTRALKQQRRSQHNDLSEGQPPAESKRGRVVENEVRTVVKFVADNPADLPRIASVILKTCASLKIFAFYGSLGAGKTALIRALCGHLGIEDDLSSPTFAIVNEYIGERTVYHIDLYRLEKQTEVLEIGMEEYLHSDEFCLIEWPQIIAELLPTETVHVSIDVRPDHSRLITVSH